MIDNLANERLRFINGKNLVFNAWSKIADDFFLKSSGDRFLKHIRLLYIWGNYPWENLLDDKVKGSGSIPYLSKRLQLLKFVSFFSLIENILWLIKQFLAFMPFRKLSSDGAEADRAFMCPTFKLEEFDQNLGEVETGFWGEIKRLDKSFQGSSCFFLIPYREEKYKSNAILVKSIHAIRMQGIYNIIPLASYFRFQILIKLILGSIEYYMQIYFILLVALFNPRKMPETIRKQFLGVIKEYVHRANSSNFLNYELIFEALQDSLSLKTLFLTCEGQPWEIAALLALDAQPSPLKVFPVCHVPVRMADTQILNYFVGGIASVVSKFLVPGLTSYQFLSSLGIDNQKINIIEAQRFPAASSSEKQIRADSNSNDVLIVEDANPIMTMELLNLISDYLEAAGHQIFLLRHPANLERYSRFNCQVVTDLDMLKTRNLRLVIFGPTTTAVLQSIFEEANPMVFVSDQREGMSPLPLSNSLRALRTREDLKCFLNTEMTTDLDVQSIILRDPNFAKWNKFLNNLNIPPKQMGV